MLADLEIADNIVTAVHMRHTHPVLAKSENGVLDLITEH